MRLLFSELTETIPVCHRADGMPSTYDLLMSIKPEGLSVNAWASRAKVNRSFFHDLKKGSNPGTETLKKVLGAIDVTLAQFYDLEGAVRAAPLTGIKPDTLPFQGAEEPLDVPLLGTAQGSDIKVGESGSVQFVERMDLNQHHIVDYVRRPAALLKRRDVYAITIVGESCAPRYEDGDPAYVDPKRQPRPGDFVVVQLKQMDGDEEQLHIALVKQLVRRTSTYVELKQCNPEIQFTIPTAEIHAIHRIIPWKEIVFF